MSKNNEATMCNECGSMIIDKTKHKRWHERVIVSSKASNHVEATEDALTDERFVGM